jgi:hypothetical protein
MHRLLRPLCGILVLMTLAATASAQSASINATAAVLLPVTVTGVRDLSFGDVYPGLNKTITVTAATSGEFSLSGQPGAQVQFSFVLPTNLTNAANTLPIGTWTGYHNQTNDASAGGQSFTPSASPTAAALAPVSGQLFVFLGATVSPSSTQAAGAYSGQITMNAAYTGL